MYNDMRGELVVTMEEEVREKGVVWYVGEIGECVVWRR